MFLLCRHGTSSQFDRRKFITMSAHICLQHVGRDAKRRAVRLRQLRLVGVIA